MTWIILLPLSVFVLSGGWAHSIFAIVVFIHNGWPITKRVTFFASLPYGMVAYAWFAICFYAMAQILNFFKSKSDPYFEIDLDRVFGE